MKKSEREIVVGHWIERDAPYLVLMPAGAEHEAFNTLEAAEFCATEAALEFGMPIRVVEKQAEVAGDGKHYRLLHRYERVMEVRPGGGHGPAISAAGARGRK